MCTKKVLLGENDINRTDVQTDKLIAPKKSEFVPGVGATQVYSGQPAPPGLLNLYGEMSIKLDTQIHQLWIHVL